jgi:hypothetical protein
MSDFLKSEDPSIGGRREHPGEIGGPPQSSAQRKWGARRRSPAKIILAGVLVILAGVSVSILAGCSNSPPPITARGTMTLYTGLLSGSDVADAFPDITTGSQVTVTNPSGTVIGTGTLAYSKADTLDFVLEAAAKMGQNAGVTAAALSQDVAVYTFTVAGLQGGLSRYGFSVGQNRGVVWESPSQAKDPGLTLGSLSS